jgi:uncharacterized membrane protein YphA (DoxX/SURF4 family)/peroxiredoxin
VDTILIITRLALVGVFLLAAVTKLLDLRGTRGALEEFRVPPRAALYGAVGLPVAELLAVLLLIPGSTARAGSIVVILLVLMFIAGILAALRRGETPDCHCFGQVHSEPVGPETLIRNAILLAGAMFVALAGPGPSPGEWLRASAGSVVALGFTSLGVLVLGYAGASLYRANRRLSGRSSQPAERPPLEAGAAAPEFSARDLSGTLISLREILAGEPRTVLVFTSATCGPCAQLLPELAQWRDMLAGRLGIRAVAAGDEAENRRLAAEHELPVLLDPDGSVAAAFRVLATPSAVEIDASGLVGGPPAAGGPAIEGLIRAALKRRGAAAVLEVEQIGVHSAGRSGAGSA